MKTLRKANHMVNQVGSLKRVHTVNFEKQSVKSSKLFSVCFVIKSASHIVNGGESYLTKNLNDTNWVL